MFLLLQKRIFSSYYWKHIVDELRSQKDLATKGSGFLKEILKGQKEDDQKHEDEMFEKLNRSLERIKDKQRQLQKSNVKDATEHFQGLFSIK
jgi:hypothetical protein